MKWSKLKSEIESMFCDSLRKRVSINSTRYGNCTCGHAWITLDKKIVANFCTMAFWNTSPVFDEEQGKFVAGENRPRGATKYDKQFVKYGEMSRQDVYESCWKFVHELGIDDALNSDEPLIQTLAVIDRRVGKSRLRQIEDLKLHPLAKKLLETRLESEKRR
nr:hypothetical protein [uncultured Desulfuromonas sp.]